MISMLVLSSLDLLTCMPQNGAFDFKKRILNITALHLFIEFFIHKPYRIII